MSKTKTSQEQTSACLGSARQDHMGDNYLLLGHLVDLQEQSPQNTELVHSKSQKDEQTRYKASMGEQYTLD